MNDIPVATSVCENIASNKGKKSREREFQANEQRRINGLLIDRYRELIKEKILEAITVMERKCVYSVVLDIDPYFLVQVESKSVPFHVLHYGNKIPYEKKWTKRTPFSEQNPDLFFSIQRELLSTKGFYLLDESTPSKSHGFFLVLHAKKPEDYDERQLLWHKGNKVLR